MGPPLPAPFSSQWDVPAWGGAVPVENPLSPAHFRHPAKPSEQDERQE